MGHLVIEKLLKALCIKNSVESENPPKTHDLLVLSERAGLNLSEERKDIFDMITTFNINARYPDYKKSFYLKCTKDFTEKNINHIQEVREWIKSLL